MLNRPKAEVGDVLLTTPTHHNVCSKKPLFGHIGLWRFAEKAVVVAWRDVRFLFFRTVTFDTKLSITAREPIFLECDCLLRFMNLSNNVRAPHLHVQNRNVDSSQLRPLASP
jgi:hypothetical protein